MDMISTSVDTQFTFTNGAEVASSHEESPQLSAKKRVDPEIELIFLGTGTSSSIPLVHCLTAQPSDEPCKTCLSTLSPEGKKNIRRNTSAVVRVTAGKDGRQTTLVIDVGKNFQAAAVEWFPKYGLREIDALLITHAHADAMNGLDDLRGWTLGNAIQKHIDVYVSQETFREVQRAFPYLVSKEFASGGGDVPDFKWHIMEDKVPFVINGIRISPFLVHHGRLFSGSPAPTFPPSPFITQPTTPTGSSPAPYLCLGFVVEDAIVYMSDVSLIPDDAWAVIEAGGPKSVLVIDCLRFRAHTSHMGLRETAGAIRRIRARRSYMTGFNHDVTHAEWVRIGEGVDGQGELGDRERRGAAMLREGLGGEVHWVRPAHDGLRVVVCGDGGVCDDSYH